MCQGAVWLRCVVCVCYVGGWVGAVLRRWVSVSGRCVAEVCCVCAVWVDAVWQRWV